MLSQELESLLLDIEMGNREKRIEALQKISEVGRGHLQEVRLTLLDVMSKGDAQIAWFASCALAKLGDQSDEAVENLVANLDPPPGENENILKYETVKALSNMKTNAQVTEVLVEKYKSEQNIGVRNGIIWALGAIGHESSRKYLEYIVNRGESEESRAAQAALELFGQGSFEEIHTRTYELGSQEQKKKGFFKKMFG